MSRLAVLLFILFGNGQLTFSHCDIMSMCVFVDLYCGGCQCNTVSVCITFAAQISCSTVKGLAGTHVVASNELIRTAADLNTAAV